MILIYAEIEVVRLYAGVNRPQTWIDQHPNYSKMQERMCESITKEGLRYPLACINEKCDGTYKVSTGNQRLHALQTLGIEKAKCVVACKPDEVGKPEGRVLTGVSEVYPLYGGDFKQIIENFGCFQIRPSDVDEWDPDLVFPNKG